MLIIKAVDTAFSVYLLMLLARILSSWVPEWQHTRPVLFLAYYTDPYLNLFKRLIPPLGMLDISPIIAFLGLQVIRGMTNFTLLLLLGYA